MAPHPLLGAGLPCRRENFYREIMDKRKHSEGTGIIEEIREKYDTMSKSQRQIANYIMTNYEQAAFMTAAKLGKAVGTSESTVVRFAAELGYDGYAGFQAALASWIKLKLNSVQKVDALSMEDDIPEIVRTVLRTDAQNLADTLSIMDGSVFESALEILMSARKVYIIGLRTCEPIATFLSFYLNMFRDGVVNISTSGTSEIFEQMIHLTSEDAVVGISFPEYSVRTLKAMEFANDRRAKLISITDNRYSPMNMYSSCNLWAKSDMISGVESMVAPLSIVNALIVALSIRCKDVLSKNTSDLTDIWENYRT